MSNEYILTVGVVSVDTGQALEIIGADREVGPSGSWNLTLRVRTAAASARRDDLPPPDPEPDPGPFPDDGVKA